MGQAGGTPSLWQCPNSLVSASQQPEEVGAGGNENTGQRRSGFSPCTVLLSLRDWIPGEQVHRAGSPMALPPLAQLGGSLAVRTLREEPCAAPFSCLPQFPFSRSPASL